MKKWIRWPGPGQIRGEGEWVEVTPDLEAYYEYCKNVNWLPTAEQDEKPKDD